jgi:hypothetical protein
VADTVPLRMGLNIGEEAEDATMREQGQHTVGLSQWVRSDGTLQMLLEAHGFAANEDGARGVAELLRDASEAILVQLGDLGSEVQMPYELPEDVAQRAKERFNLTEPVQADGQITTELGRMTPAGHDEYNRLWNLRRPGETVLDVERREREERDSHAHRTAQRPSIDSYKTPERVERAREARAAARADRKTFRPHP